DLVEILERRRLTVPREGNVIEPAELRRSSFEFLHLENPAARAQIDDGTEFLEQTRRFHKLRLALAGAVDLAIDAVEVADLVRVEVHADGNSLAPPAED